MKYNGPHTFIPAVTLVGPRLTLVPLDMTQPDSPETIALFDQLFTAVSNSEELFQYMTLGPFKSADELRAHYQRICSLPIGCQPDKRVELGSVWIGAYLMLCHAFENGRAEVQRVEWTAHHLNVASQQTALKIGFVYEGTFRKHRFYKNTVRNSFWYSIIDDEWAEKKERLQKMLNII
ncbi:acyl-CoA N-acyltransferase [Rhizoclosmatium globosum]|uniref:Acyl-CoA N-acyltransferase n=1 Tax=Rhizoclosmatium globosum TaxID=329046 RepID=A0A1Y2D1V8_9FUNG|nr:acyl-CoA N-acyltransferase [Rhizoclosmatium globosum]|eukprot:ORY53273.1 acyl-CoA N-acyltransferase [Rhizoclosmatium globosum]